MMEIITKSGETYHGELIRIDYSTWGRKRKAELTLVCKPNSETIVAIPMAEIKSIINQ